MLSRDFLLQQAAPAPVPFPVPEWHGEIALRPLSVAGVIAWGDALRDEARRTAGEATALLVLHGACTAEGSPLFEAADLPWLLAQPGVALQRIAARVLEISGFETRPAEGNAQAGQ